MRLIAICFSLGVVRIFGELRDAISAADLVVRF
jgi:hypothetical protein